jgi:hypothetical protein
MEFPSALLAGPPYRPGEHPGRETRLERLDPHGAGSPWLTALVSFRALLAVFTVAFAAVILLASAGSSDARWWYALSLAMLETARAGRRVLRRYRPEAGRGRP